MVLRKFRNLTSWLVIFHLALPVSPSWSQDEKTEKEAPISLEELLKSIQTASETLPKEKPEEQAVVAGQEDEENAEDSEKSNSYLGAIWKGVKKTASPENRYINLGVGGSLLAILLYGRIKKNYSNGALRERIVNYGIPTPEESYAHFQQKYPKWKIQFEEARNQLSEVDSQMGKRVGALSSNHTLRRPFLDVVGPEACGEHFGALVPRAQQVNRTWKEFAQEKTHWRKKQPVAPVANAPAKELSEAEQTTHTELVKEMRDDLQKAKSGYEAYRNSVLEVAPEIHELTGLLSKEALEKMLPESQYLKRLVSWDGQMTEEVFDLPAAITAIRKLEESLAIEEARLAKDLGREHWKLTEEGARRQRTWIEWGRDKVTSPFTLRNWLPDFSLLAARLYRLSPMIGVGLTTFGLEYFRNQTEQELKKEKDHHAEEEKQLAEKLFARWKLDEPTARHWIQVLSGLWKQYQESESPIYAESAFPLALDVNGVSLLNQLRDQAGGSLLNASSNLREVYEKLWLKIITRMETASLPATERPVGKALKALEEKLGKDDKIQAVVSQLAAQTPEALEKAQSSSDALNMEEVRVRTFGVFVLWTKLQKDPKTNPAFTGKLKDLESPIVFGLDPQGLEKVTVMILRARQLSKQRGSDFEHEFWNQVILLASVEAGETPAPTTKSEAMEAEKQVREKHKDLIDLFSKEAPSLLYQILPGIVRELMNEEKPTEEAPEALKESPKPSTEEPKEAAETPEEVEASEASSLNRF